MPPSISDGREALLLMETIIQSINLYLDTPTKIPEIQHAERPHVDRGQSNADRVRYRLRKFRFGFRPERARLWNSLAHVVQSEFETYDWLSFDNHLRLVSLLGPSLGAFIATLHELMECVHRLNCQADFNQMGQNLSKAFISFVANFRHIMCILSYSCHSVVNSWDKLLEDSRRNRPHALRHWETRIAPSDLLLENTLATVYRANTKLESILGRALYPSTKRISWRDLEKCRTEARVVYCMLATASRFCCSCSKKHNVFLRLSDSTQCSDLLPLGSCSDGFQMMLQNKSKNPWTWKWADMRMKILHLGSDDSFDEAQDSEIQQDSMAKVRFANETTVGQPKRGSTTHPNVCGKLTHSKGDAEHDTYRVDGGLLGITEVSLRRLGPNYGSSASVESLKTSLDLTQKLRFALEVSLSILTLYQTPWLDGRWTIENVLCIRTRKEVLPGAILRYRLSDSTSQFSRPDADAPSIMDPYVFSLGIFLLELSSGISWEEIRQLANPLPEKLPDLIVDPIAANSIVNGTLDVILDITDDPFYREAIRMCFSNCKFSGHASLEAEDFTQAVFQQIIVPLHYALEDQLQKSSETGDDSKLTATNTTLQTRESLYDQSPTTTQAVLMPVSTDEVPPWDTIPEEMTNDAQFFELFDYEDAPPEMDSGSGQWIREFVKFRKRLFPDPYPVEMPRVRVAVLDTGIDVKNRFIRDHWLNHEWRRPSLDKKNNTLPDRGYKDFVSAEGEEHSPRDNDGHGTHVAGIIIQYAPDALLHIARIADTKMIMREDKDLPRRVSMAIRHAANVWDADIVSLSFGIRNSDGQVARAIREAEDKGVIIFAAAANHGNIHRVAFPAEMKEVFCINSSNGYGKPTSFNPSPRRGKPNFSILGLNIKSAWPDFENSDDGVTRIDDGSTWKCLSGSSTATPLAAAFIALIFQYYKLHHRKIQSKKPLNCYSGVESVLYGMSVEEKDFDDIVPWRGRDDHCLDPSQMAVYLGQFLAKSTA